MFTMPKRYVPLAPASVSRNASDSTSNGLTQDEPFKRKRIGTQLACNNCRAKKTRCDGVRPVCGPCARRGVSCAYNDKKEPSDEAIEILELLKTVPEKTSFEILRLFRAHYDPAMVLSMVKVGSIGGVPQLSTYVAADGLDAPTLSPFEWELMTRNPVAYPALPPISVSALERSSLLHPFKEAERESQDQRSPSASIPDGQFLVDGGQPVGPPNIDHDSATRPFRVQAALENTPMQAATLCDDRLRSLNISFWTNVQVADAFAARVISMYLETDHPLLGTFDPDQFVADLVNRQQVSCSRFLVNAVLYWGSLMYSAVEKEASTFSLQFCDEAELLWITAQTQDSILNMAGAQILSLAFIGNGKDHKVIAYSTAAINMGTRLGLIDVDDDTAIEYVQQMTEGQQKASSFAAWAVFNWATLMSFFYRMPIPEFPDFNMEYPDSPPILPIPGEAGEDWMDSGSPPTQTTLPPYMGRTFQAACQFWRIVHELSLIYHSKKGISDPRRGSLDFAEMKFRELLAWLENLPSMLVRNDENPHHVVIFHMWIHAVILDIFRPWMRRQKDEQLRLKTFSAVESTPEAVYVASVNQLKHLIVHYRSNYESSTYTILWHTALTYVANAVLQDLNDPEWRVYLVLCIHGYETLRRPFRVSEAIGRGLLTMTLHYRDMSSEVACELMGQLKDRGLRHISEEIRATFIADLDLAMTQPNKATVERLADEFEKLLLLQQDKELSEAFTHYYDDDFMRDGDMQ
ncbi:hypothetical protein BJ170DRAFT_303366 [Xylariales sp. AK1849]|nr:hypothetical protein BJ170DRAFT_303366 [Xylariales sp. AK1849]